MNRKLFFIALFLFAAIASHTEMRFDGIDDYYNNTDITLPGPFTVAFWFKNYINSGTRSFASDGAGGTDRKFGHNGAGKFFCRIITAGSADQSVTAPDPSLTDYHHFALTRDSQDKINMWIDGVPAFFSDTEQVGDYAVNVIGADTTTPAQLSSATFSDFRIYNVLLSTAQIQSLAFSRTYLLITDGLQRWFPLDDGRDGHVSDGSHLIRDRSPFKQNGAAPVGPIWYASTWLSWPGN